MKKIILVLLLIFIIGCAKEIEQKDTEIANPASVYCEEQKGSLEIRTDADGNHIGYCLKDGKECEEWAFYRGECSLEQKT